MIRGAWHQLGWQHQKLVIEQIKQGAGVGVVLSPRDLSFSKAQEYAAQYKDVESGVLYDPQWHIPAFSNVQLDEYPTAKLRDTVTNLINIAESRLADLAEMLEEENSALRTDAVIAPAIVYQAGRTDISQLNAKLHTAARRAAANLNVPCYGTAFLGESVTDSIELVQATLSTVTSLRCDGWYFGFEFPAERIPSSTDAIYRCLRAILLLASTGHPVMHAYAGPLGILSFSSGCTAAASGPSQKQWRFCPERWEDVEATGGNSALPARYFSRALWGTVVFPDETGLLPSSMQARIFSPSPFATAPPPMGWSRTDAKKHLTHTICKGLQDIADKGTTAECRKAANELLGDAVQLHEEIAEHRVELRDNAASYQANWQAALGIMLERHEDDFEFLELLE